MKISNFHDLFVEELRDLYSAEEQIVVALPKMIDHATNDELIEALENHLEETKTQIHRLQEIATELGFKIEGHECMGMKGIIQEGEKMIKEISDPNVRDAAIITAAQRVEHYEIAGYGGAIAFASEMDEDTVESLLNETLSEEGAADKLLTTIASGGLFSTGINEVAAEN